MDILVKPLEDAETAKSCLLLHEPVSRRTLVACRHGSADLRVDEVNHKEIGGLLDGECVVRRVEPGEFNRVYRATRGTHVRTDFLDPLPSLVSVVEEFYDTERVSRPVNRLVF